MLDECPRIDECDTVGDAAKGSKWEVLLVEGIGIKIVWELELTEETDKDDEWEKELTEETGKDNEWEIELTEETGKDNECEIELDGISVWRLEFDIEGWVTQLGVEIKDLRGVCWWYGIEEWCTTSMMLALWEEASSTEFWNIIEFIIFLLLWPN